MKPEIHVPRVWEITQTASIEDKKADKEWQEMRKILRPNGQYLDKWKWRAAVKAIRSR